MTARKKAGQEGFAHEVERLIGYGRAAEDAREWESAMGFFTRALEIVNRDGLSQHLRNEAENGFLRARSQLKERERGV